MSTDESKFTVSSCQEVKVKIQMNAEHNEEVSCLKFLGVIIPSGKLYEETTPMFDWILQVRRGENLLWKTSNKSQQQRSSYWRAL